MNNVRLKWFFYYIHESEFSTGRNVRRVQYLYG